MMPETKSKKIHQAVHFPWISISSFIILCALLLENLYPQHLALISAQAFLSSPITHGAALAITIILLLLEIIRFSRQRQLSDKKIAELEEELDYIWKSKKKLQERSQIYSGHADKLKQFISDKLLDYIEYDEKFLHFKSIAAEVRHNGVISYDIVKTALQNALKNNPQSPSSPINLADTHRFGLPNNPCSDSQQALDAMKYLWDLLDLSTAENIALHIGNFLIECEEQYYQLELSPNSQKNQNSSEKPFFTPSIAVIKTIGPLMELSQMDQLIAKAIKENTNNGHPEENETLFETSLFRIELNKTEHLLGNPNHLILMLENIVKNAQFFSAKSKFKQKSDRISIQLTQKQGYIQLNIYNRGPHITEDNLETIFQLGFSTRRVKEHHGKGLGMYFVKEIVKGYQGQITVQNTTNMERSFLIRITLANQEVIREEVATRHDSPRPTLTLTDHVRPIEKLEKNFHHAVSSVEINVLNSKDQYRFDDIPDNEDFEIIDSGHPFKPEWRIDIKRKRKQEWHFAFTPLDTEGVEFTVKLPTAEARLEGIEPTFREDFENEVAQLDEQFSDSEGF